MTESLAVKTQNNVFVIDIKLNIDNLDLNELIQTALKAERMLILK